MFAENHLSFAYRYFYNAKARQTESHWLLNSERMKRMLLFIDTRGKPIYTLSLTGQIIRISWLYFKVLFSPLKIYWTTENLKRIINIFFSYDILWHCFILVVNLVYTRIIALYSFSSNNYSKILITCINIDK